MIALNSVRGSSLLSVCRGLLLLLVAPAFAWGSLINWSGAGTDNDWATGQNWIGNAPPTDDISTDAAVFNLGSYAGIQPVISADRSVRDIRIQGAGELQISGAGTLSMNQFSTVGITKAANSGAATIDVNIRLPSANDIYWENHSDTLLTVGGSVELVNASTRLLGRGDGNIHISGDISGAGQLARSFSGTGLLILSGNNTHQGELLIGNGGVRIAGANALSSNANLRFSNTNAPEIGGYLELTGGGTFTRELGTGSNQVQLVTTGGFSAYGQSVAVNIGGAGQTLSWTSGGNIFGGGAYASARLLLNGPTATHDITLVNPIDFGTGIEGTRNIRVDAQTAILQGKVTDNLGGAKNLVKHGSGVLWLASTENDYRGWTYIGSISEFGGGVRASSAAGGLGTGLLFIRNGYFEITNGTFTRSVGSGSNQVSTYSGGNSPTATGFSAYGMDATVNLGGSAVALTWSTSNWLSTDTSNGNTFILNGPTANANLALMNPLVLGSTGTHTRAIRTDAMTATLHGDLSQTGAGVFHFAKQGAGTLVLADTTNNIFQGNTLVEAGTLRVNGALDTLAANAYSVTVQDGATLGGSGTIGGAGGSRLPVQLLAGAALAPGNSPGILNAGDISFASGSNFDVQLFGTTAGNDPNSHDQLNVVGSVTLAGLVNLNVDLGSFAPGLGDTFVIINNDDFDAIAGGLFTADGINPLNDSGTFSVGAYQFQINYFHNGNDVALNVTAVPEPSTWALICAGGVACAMGIRRRRREATPV